MAERLTLEEAMAHTRQVALENRREATYNFPDLKEYYQRCNDCAEEYEQLAEWLEELKRYKDLEEQHRLIELPCKVGDTVYILGDRFPAEIDCIIITKNRIVFSYCEYEKSYELTELCDYGEFTAEDIGKIVFLTKEAAEAALKEQNNECENM